MILLAPYSVWVRGLAAAMMRLLAIAHFAAFIPGVNSNNAGVSCFAEKALLFLYCFSLVNGPLGLLKCELLI